MGRVVGEEELIRIREAARRDGRLFVFTNGCFDILHAGHVSLLRKAKAEGDLLAVGLNGDDSVRLLKGEARPIVPAGERAELLAALEPVDCVVLFHEETPARLIRLLAPDVLVKGGDWGPREIVGADAVRAAGGRVVIVPCRPGLSTRALIERIVGRYGRVD